MRTSDDLDAYLMKSGHEYESIGDDGHMWALKDTTGETIVIRVVEGLVVFRTKVMELARVSKREALYHKLLELNASDMVHGSYGLEDDSVVLTCVLRLESLDYSEVLGTIDDFSLALSNHYPLLSEFRDAA